MHNEIILTKLEICLEHINAIEIYFGSCNSPEEFFRKNEGLHYDACLMRLQALSENLKKISEKHPEVIQNLNYPHILYIIRFRDLLSHHYEKIEQDIVFDTCKINIPEFKKHLIQFISVNK